MTDREAFETWATASPEGFLLSMERSESPFASCCAYNSGRTETAWLAWQASRQQALDERYPYENVLIKILGVVQRYLPPDGPLTEKEALSEIISLVDPGPWPPGPLPTPITTTRDKA